MELRFCCSCFKKYEKLSFDEFPIKVKEKIRIKLAELKEISDKLKEIDKIKKEDVGKKDKENK